MKRFLLPTIAILTATQADAFCGEMSFMEFLSPERQAEVQAKAADVINAQGLFWTATRGEDTLYIAGSVHIYTPELDRLIDTMVSKVIAPTEVLLTEASAEDFAKVNQMLAADPSLILLPDNKTLIDLMDPVAWAALHEVLRDRGIPAFTVGRLKPFMVATQLSLMSECINVQDPATMEGVDHSAFLAAQELDIPNKSLEAPTTIFELMDRMPLDDQIATLEIANFHPEIINATLSTMVNAYLDQDISLLMVADTIPELLAPYADPDEADRIMAAQNDLLLDQRNHNWIPVIEAETAEFDEISVVVGAAHLPGEDGILNLLAENGWSIARIE